MDTFRNVPNRIRVLIIVCCLYLYSFAAFPGATVLALRSFLDSLAAVLPILAVVFFVMFLGQLFLSPSTVSRYVGEHSGAKGWLVVLLGSIFMSGPQYVMFPLLRELKAQGMKNSLIAVFLNNRNVQPAFVPVMAFYFGMPFTVTFSLLVLAYALLSGLMVGYLVKDR